VIDARATLARWREGRLPSAVAGLVSRPVIAVPTSVGCGASFGFGAAYAAAQINCALHLAAHPAK
jgi:NCAIR mutase (PurE)-related protein